MLELRVAASSPGQTFSFLEETRAELLLESLGGFPRREGRRKEEKKAGLKATGLLPLMLQGLSASPILQRKDLLPRIPL